MMSLTLYSIVCCCRRRRKPLAASCLPCKATTRDYFIFYLLCQIAAQFLACFLPLRVARLYVSKFYSHKPRSITLDICGKVHQKSGFLNAFVLNSSAYPDQPLPRKQLENEKSEPNTWNWVPKRGRRKKNKKSFVFVFVRSLPTLKKSTGIL